MTEPELVQCVNVMLRGKGRKTAQPDLLHRAQTMQQDYCRSLSCIDIANVLSENDSGFFRRNRRILAEE